MSTSKQSLKPLILKHYPEATALIRVEDELSAKTLFGTNGIRGVVNQELTPEFVVKVGVAIGTYFGGGRILIGYDCRTSNILFLNAITAGLISTGCTVLEGGCAPTPAIQYAVNHFKLDGGIIVTASHNPAEYNGIKLIPTYHPAALLRNEQWKRPTWEDLKRLRLEYDGVTV